MLRLTMILIGVAGFAGAILRFWLGAWIGRRWTSPFPMGTFVINIAGAFALGLLIGLSDRQLVPAAWRLVLGTGFLGAFTTFSTWMLETAHLTRTRSYLTAAANVVTSILCGLGAAGLGLAVARL